MKMLNNIPVGEGDTSLLKCCPLEAEMIFFKMKLKI